MPTKPVDPAVGGGIGPRIRWMIEERLQVSHTEFARRLGVKPPQISRWLNRADYSHNERSLARIAEIGNVSVPWLRYGVGPLERGEVAWGKATVADRTGGTKPETLGQFDGS
jgi:transcriptional regulator with XRE-family HTH domain